MPPLFFSMLLWLFVAWITLWTPPISCVPSGVTVYNQDDAEQGIRCKEIESKALLTFKSGLVDEEGFLSSWSDDDDNPNCCNWKGVSCSNQTGHVLKLDLNNKHGSHYPLQGEVSSSLLELKYLEYLDLSLNDFYPSKIPSFLGSLEKLRYLNLSRSSFSGFVPPHLGNLSSLHYLDLSDNGLEAESLEWLRGLPHLKHLNFNYIDLRKAAGDDWLKAVNMLPSLLELHLSDCGLPNLPASIHHSINLTTSLSTLDLSYNDFSSSLSLPLWLLNLTGLVNLRLSFCSLCSVSILDGFEKLVELQELDLSGSCIRGQLPASLGNLSNLVSLGHLCKLRKLDLSFNKLEGEISEFINGLARCSYDGNSHNLEGETLPSALASLDLSDNLFWGSIPTSIGRLTSLETLDLSYNNMNGTIAESIGQLVGLESLYLYDNPWQGLLTENHFHKHTKLLHFGVATKPKGGLVMNVTQDWSPPFTSIREFQLSGVKMWSKEFPAWIETLHELEELGLWDCGISGAIPSEFWKSCTNVTGLYLSHNAISIGTSFKNMEALLPLVPARSLEYLYLANNTFSSNSNSVGEIPSSIGLLAPSLQELDLSSNSISGKIPPSICELKKLRVLGLRNNLLSGELTQHQWEDMESLGQFDVSNNKLHGKIPESLGSLRDLFIVSLNDNHLEGEVPSFRNCTSLQILDLGRNSLIGEIPAMLATNKLSLFILRIRENRLSGSIPPEICLLSGLHTLDLAHNSFRGMIPRCLGNLSKRAGLGNYSQSYLFQTTVVSKGRESEYKGYITGSIYAIDLSNNNLSGEVPVSIMDLNGMQTLNLSMNHLTGEIPSNIGMLRMLWSLDLSQNQLSGPIPRSLSDLSFLSDLNLSQNNLSGEIPLAGTQLQTLNDSSRYEGNPLLCGPPLPTVCPGNDEPTKGHQGEKEEHGKSGFSLDDWGFVLSLVLGFIVGFWGICGSLVISVSWRNAYFGFLQSVKDKVIVIILVHVARLRRKLDGD